MCLVRKDKFVYKKLLETPNFDLSKWIPSSWSFCRSFGPGVLKGFVSKLDLTNSTEVYLRRYKTSIMGLSYKNSSLIFLSESFSCNSSHCKSREKIWNNFFPIKKYFVYKQIFWYFLVAHDFAFESNVKWQCLILMKNSCYQNVWPK